MKRNNLTILEIPVNQLRIIYRLYILSVPGCLADVTPFVGPGPMRVGVVMLQLPVDLPPGAYAPGGPSAA